MFDKLFTKDEKAISPVVATLILIVVAIVGAVAIGALLGVFSANVGDQANSNNVSDNFNQVGQLSMSGSTTCYPVNVLLASAFMKAHPGSHVTVGQGGSGKGVTDVGNNVVNIGTTSRVATTAEMASYPNLQAHQIGARGVVVIAGKNVVEAAGLLGSDLATAYDSGTATSVVTGLTDTAGPLTLYQRAETGSGTEEAFSAFLGDCTASKFKTAKSVDLSAAQGVTGNGGMLAAVQGNPDSIGFVDFGYVDSTTKLGSAQILKVTTTTGAHVCSGTSDNFQMLLEK